MNYINVRSLNISSTDNCDPLLSMPKLVLVVTYCTLGRICDMSVFVIISILYKQCYMNSRSFFFN